MILGFLSKKGFLLDSLDRGLYGSSGLEQLLFQSYYFHIIFNYRIDNGKKRFEFIIGYR